MIFFYLYIYHLRHYFLTLRRYFRYKTKVLLKNDYFLIVEKEYDMKINSNNVKDKTVQTFLNELYPYLASDRLYHNFYFVHRLDFATSGVMCIPLDKKTCRVVSEAFQSRKTKKYYVAVVWGLFSTEFVDVDIPIGEDVNGKVVQKMCTNNYSFCSQPRSARTLILVLENGLYNNYPATKVLIRPVTGRRHQIRVHCAYLGHRIVGDYTYSNKKDTEPPRMFLHSYRLYLPNPICDLDVRTGDPFSRFGNWKSINVLNTVYCNKTFDKIDALLNK